MNRASVPAFLFLAVLLAAAIAPATGTASRHPGVGASGQGSLPSPRSAWANLTASADSTITSAYPTANFGAGSFLQAASDPANGTASRALLQFDLTSIPSDAQVTSATLQVYASRAAGSPAVEAHRVLAQWDEGFGTEYLYTRAVTVAETAGVARTREPVEARITLGTPLRLNPSADFRVFDAAGNEIPSQVIRVTYAGSDITAATVVFESSNRPFETRSYEVRYGYILPTVPAYRQPTPWASLWSYPAGATYSSPAVADLDGDGRLETVVGSPDGNVYAVHANGTRMWASNLGAPIESPIAVADTDGDGRLDVLAMTDGTSNHRVYSLAAANGATQWDTAGNPSKAGQGPLVVADTNGDGIMEIYVGATDRSVWAFNGASGALLWSRNLGPSAQAYGGALANFTGSPAPDLIFGTSNGLLNALDTAGNVIWSVQPGSNALLQTPGVADLDGDGLMELVAGDRAASGSEFAVWGQNGSIRWTTSTGSDQSGGNVIVDFGDDGRLETVFAETTAGRIGVVSDQGKWVWNFTTGGTIYSTPAAADVNGDGEEDIVVGSFDNHLYVIGSNGTLIRSIPTDSPVRGTPVIADIDGDGTLDIVFATQTQIQAVMTASLGHDTRVGAYNLRNTGHFLDGNSPDGAALLGVVVGSEQTRSSSGVTWTTTNGVTGWTIPGGEYDATILGSGTVSAGTWSSVDLTGLVRDWIANVYPNVGILLRLLDETQASVAVLGSRESAGTEPILRILYSVATAPQILSTVPDQIKPEDSPPWTLNLVGFASEPGTPLSNLSWNLAGVDSSLYDYTGGNVTGNHKLIFQAKPNAYGNNRVTLFLFDQAGRYDSQTMWVNLTPVNDPPVFTPPTTFYVHYDTPYTFDFTPYMRDPDNAVDTLYLTTSDPAHSTVAGHNLTLLYPQSLLDTWQFVTVTVSDGSAATSRTIAVRITSDFPPEQRNALPDVTMREGETRIDVFGHPLDYYFFDRDNDTLFYTFGFTHLDITINQDKTVDIVALGEWWGTESVTFRATDPTGALLEDTILVNVTPVNDPPTISSVPSLFVHFDYSYDFDLTPYISDPDTPIAQIAVSTNDPSHVGVSGRVMTLLYPDRGIGQYLATLVINVTDGLGYSLALTTVTVTNDYPPVLRKTLPDVIFFEDTVQANFFNLDDYFYDNDSATVFYTSGQVHVSVTIDPTHNVTFAAEANWSGVETVRFRATDDKGAIAEDTIKVIVQPVDDAPVIELGDWQNQVRDRHSWFLDISSKVTDIEDVNKTFLQLIVSSAAGPGFVQIAGLNLLFSYPDSVSSDTVTITAKDEQGLLSNVVTIHVRILGPDIFGVVLPWVAAGLVAATSVLIWKRIRPNVEEVFLVHFNGLPIAHLSRTLKAEKDTDLVTSMFTAVQNFTNDIFRARGAGDLNALQLGDYRLSVARGTSAFLAVLYHGRHSRGVERKAHDVIEEVEDRYGTVLANWDGDMEKLEGVKEFIERFFKAKASATLARGPPKRLGSMAGLDRVESAMRSITDLELPESVETLPPPPPPEPGCGSQDMDR